MARRGTSNSHVLPNVLRGPSHMFGGSRSFIAPESQIGARSSVLSVRQLTGISIESLPRLQLFFLPCHIPLLSGASCLHRPLLKHLLFCIFPTPLYDSNLPFAHHVGRQIRLRSRSARAPTNQCHLCLRSRAKWRQHERRSLPGNQIQHLEARQ